MPKPVLCAICDSKIPYGTIHADLLSHHPRFGKPHPGQSTIACPSCGRYLHVACVEEAGTSIAWHHLIGLAKPLGTGALQRITLQSQ